MDPSNITATVRELTVFLPYAAGIFLILAVPWVIYRTKSDHVVRRLIWRVVHGKEEVSDADVRLFIREQSDLMAFRFESNLHIRTIEQARELARWLKKNDEDVSAVRRCRGYFDLENCRPKESLPGRPVFVALAIALIVFILPVYFLLSATSSEQVLLKVNDSGTWFLASADVDRASPWPPKIFMKQPEPLLADSCNLETSSAPTPTPFDDEDTRIICDLLLDQEAPDYLSNSLVQQRIALIVLAFVLAIPAYAAFRELLAIQATRQVSKRLASRCTQLDLDLDLDK